MPLIFLPVVEMSLFGNKIKVKKRRAGPIAYIEFKGPYDKIPFDQYFGKLFSWARESKAGMRFGTFAVYASDPAVTPAGDLLTKVAIPIGKAVPSSGEIKVDTLPEMDVATLDHNAPAEDYSKSYGELQKWISENGYEVLGAPMEVYTRKPKVKDGKTIIYSEIQFPVRKK
jgi:effector-binding domain-containing protein